MINWIKSVWAKLRQHDRINLLEQKNILLSEALESSAYPDPPFVMFYLEEDSIISYAYIGNPKDMNSEQLAEVVNKLIMIYCVLYCEEDFDNLRRVTIGSLGKFGDDVNNRIDTVLDAAQALEKNKPFNNVHINNQIL